MEADGEMECGNLEKKKSKSRRREREREREIFCYLSWWHRGGSSQPTIGATTAHGGSLVAWSSDDVRLQMGSGLWETIKPKKGEKNQRVREIPEIKWERGGCCRDSGEEKKQFEEREECEEILF